MAASSSEVSVAALRKTHQSLLQIQKRLQPFLDKLKSPEDPATGEDGETAVPSTGARTGTCGGGGGGASSSPSPAVRAAERAVAQAAVALSLGTLRVIGARLQGHDRGRKSDDPLRRDLDRIRTVLVAAQKKYHEAAQKDRKKIIEESSSHQRDGGGVAKEVEPSGPTGVPSNKRKQPADDDVDGTEREEEEFPAKKPKADSE